MPLYDTFPPHTTTFVQDGLMQKGIPGQIIALVVPLPQVVAPPSLAQVQLPPAQQQHLVEQFPQPPHLGIV